MRVPRVPDAGPEIAESPPGQVGSLEGRIVPRPCARLASKLFVLSAESRRAGYRKSSRETVENEALQVL
jgi:hypothetical protein